MQYTQHTRQESKGGYFEERSRKILDKLILYQLFSLSGSGRMIAPGIDKTRTRVCARVWSIRAIIDNHEHGAVVRDGRSWGSFVQRRGDRLA